MADTRPLRPHGQPARLVTCHVPAHGPITSHHVRPQRGRPQRGRGLTADDAWRPGPSRDRARSRAWIPHLVAFSPRPFQCTPRPFSLLDRVRSQAIALAPVSQRTPAHTICHVPTSTVPISPLSPAYPVIAATRLPACPVVARQQAGCPCSLSHAHALCHVLTSRQETGARWGQASPARSASRQETDAG